MPHFLVNKNEINDNFITLCDKETFFHLVKVLRVKIDETIKFIDENGIVYFSKVVEINKNNLKAKILEKKNSERFLKNNYYLIQSILSNNDSQNMVIANATQLGVKEIYPVISDNCSIKKSDLSKKLEKWQKIAFENFKQCERKDIPKINEISNLKVVLSKFKKENVIIFAERNENCSLNQINLDTKEKIALVIGPEGGFSDNEFEYFKKNDYKLMTLGKMILKAPTAVSVSISNVVSRVEND